MTQSTLRRLHQLTDELNAANLENLLTYAEFLLSRQPEARPVSDTPVLAPRPENESVIAAIRRLSLSYPMLARDELFNEASSLMAKHVMHGESREETIDRLEALFESRYAALRDPVAD